MKNKTSLIIAILAVLAVAAGVVWYKFYRRSVEHPPEPEETISEADQLRAQANRQFRRKEYSAAVATLTQLIQKDAKDKTAFLGRANAHLAQMNYDEALRDYDSAIAVDPSYADAYFARGTMRWLLGELALAEWDYSTTVQLAPDENFFYSQLARVLYEEKAADKVKVLYREAYRKDPRRVWALDGWFGAMFELKEFDEILEEHEQILANETADSIDPKSILAPGYYAGVVYVQRKEYDRAIEVFESCVSRAPNDVNLEAYGHLASAYRETAQAQKCRSRLSDYDHRTGRKTPPAWCDGGGI